MLDSGANSFYKQENGQHFYFDFVSNQYVALPEQPGVIVLKSVKDRTGIIKKNSGASLIDVGDGVACLEFHSKMNSIGGDTLQMLKQSLAEVEKNFVGLVVGNQGTELLRGRQHHVDVDDGAGRRLGRARHDGPRVSNGHDEFALLSQNRW